jgi:hypothetical protein
MQYLFVGEKRSKTAIAKGWTWADGRLAAKTLQEALALLGLRYGKGYECINLLDDNGVFSTKTIQALRTRVNAGWILVSMGAQVDRTLTAYEVPHLRITHPAARGKIRTRAHYRAHVKERLAL